MSNLLTESSEDLSLHKIQKVKTNKFDNIKPFNYVQCKKKIETLNSI